eukprot:5387582-Amphidinium_carterae.1
MHAKELFKVSQQARICKQVSTEDGFDVILLEEGRHQGKDKGTLLARKTPPSTTIAHIARDENIVILRQMLCKERSNLQLVEGLQWRE